MRAKWRTVVGSMFALVVFVGGAQAWADRTTVRRFECPPGAKLLPPGTSHPANQVGSTY